MLVTLVWCGSLRISYKYVIIIVSLEKVLVSHIKYKIEKIQIKYKSKKNIKSQTHNSLKRQELSTRELSF